MNQKIRELASEHLSRTEYENGNVHECYEFSEQELAKFAELIIKECIEVINDNVEVALSATGIVVFEDELLKKHFGIE